MSSTKPLPERTETIYRELRSLRRRFRLGGWITLIVGSLLLLLVAAYFSYGYSEIASLRNPDLIVSLVGNTVDAQIPIIRQRIESEVNTNASTWAEQASKQVLAEIPPARKQIEQAALTQADKMIAQIDVLGEKQFRKIVDENRATVQQAIDQLKNDEEISEEVVQGLQLALEKELQIDAASQGDAVRTIVSDLREAIEKLHAGENLSAEQQAERRVLMLARRWQMETIGDVNYKELDLSVVKELAGEHENKRLRKETAELGVDSSDASAAPANPDAKPEEK
jgi:hypothetical protein